MSWKTKGCLQIIVSVQTIPSTSQNKTVIGGGRALVKLGCGHEKEIRLSALSKRPNRSSIPKKAQCWICVDEAKHTETP